MESAIYVMRRQWKVDLDTISGVKKQNNLMKMKQLNCHF